MNYDIAGKASVDAKGKWDVSYTMTPAADPKPPAPKPIFHFLAGEITPNSGQLASAVLGTETTFAGGSFENPTAALGSTMWLGDAGELVGRRITQIDYRQHQLRVLHDSFTDKRFLQIGTEYKIKLDFQPLGETNWEWSWPIEFWGPAEGQDTNKQPTAGIIAKPRRGIWHSIVMSGHRSESHLEIREEAVRPFVYERQVWQIVYRPHPTDGLWHTIINGNVAHDFRGCTVLTKGDAERIGPVIQVGHYTGDGQPDNGFAFNEIRIETS